MTDTNERRTAGRATGLLWLVGGAAKRAGRDRAVVHDQALASISPLKNSMSAF